MFSDVRLENDSIKETHSRFCKPSHPSLSIGSTSSKDGTQDRLAWVVPSGPAHCPRHIKSTSEIGKQKEKRARKGLTGA
ncbi:hypothetical protein HZ326_27183 [Fusarium oxysporum f. sp. albedinis]|nr:hypothetical protein HZ326_27183 [Fusarium oxysporum f. sp. albedinis]